MVGQGRERGLGSGEWELEPLTSISDKNDGLYVAVSKEARGGGEI